MSAKDPVYYRNRYHDVVKNNPTMLEKKRASNRRGSTAARRRKGIQPRNPKQPYIPHPRQPSQGPDRLDLVALRDPAIREGRYAN